MDTWLDPPDCEEDCRHYDADCSGCGREFIFDHVSCGPRDCEQDLWFALCSACVNNGLAWSPKGYLFQYLED